MIYYIYIYLYIYIYICISTNISISISISIYIYSQTGDVTMEKKTHRIVMILAGLHVNLGLQKP